MPWDDAASGHLRKCATAGENEFALAVVLEGLAPGGVGVHVVEDQDVAVAKAGVKSAVILGDPYAKKSPSPHIGVTSCLPVSPSIPNHQMLGQSCLLNGLALPHTLSRRAPLE